MDAATRLRKLADDLDGYLVSTLLEIPHGAEWDPATPPAQFMLATTANDDRCQYRATVEARGEDGARLWRRWKAIVEESATKFRLLPDNPLCSAVVLSHRAISAKRTPLLMAPPAVFREFAFTGEAPAKYVLYSAKCGDICPEVAAKSVLTDLVGATALAIEKLHPLLVTLSDVLWLIGRALSPKTIRNEAATSKRPLPKGSSEYAEWLVWWSLSRWAKSIPLPDELTAKDELANRDQLSNRE